MIEKLMNLESSYGEPNYSKLSEQINHLQHTISAQLLPQTRNQLDQLADAYIRRETVALHDAFADGFCTGLELILEVYQRNRI